MSGRGVGLDVVKTNIAGLSGVIDVESRAGEGTTFRVTLPVTLATVLGTARRGEQTGVRGPPQQRARCPGARRPGGGPRAREPRRAGARAEHPGRVAGRDLRAPVPGRRRLYLVVVGVAERRLGLVVDALHGQRDLVTQTLGPRLGQVPGVSGAAEVGHHHTVLVLDVGALLDEVLRGPPRLGAQA